MYAFYDFYFIYQVAFGNQLDMDIDIANRMALFYAHPMPMLNAIIDNTTWLVVQVSSLSCKYCDDLQSPCGTGEQFVV